MSDDARPDRQGPDPPQLTREDDPRADDPSPRRRRRLPRPRPHPPEAEQEVPRLGEQLLTSGLVTTAQVEEALATADRSGERLGRVLLAEGAVSRWTLFQNLSQQWGLPLVNLQTEEIDSELTSTLDPQELISFGLFPLRWDRGSLLVATTEQPNAKRARLARQILHTPVHDITWVITTDWDIAKATSIFCADRLLDDATDRLARDHPALSARQVLTSPQRLIILMLLLALLIGAVMAPQGTLQLVIVALNLLFAGSLFFKGITALVGLLGNPGIQISDKDVAALRDHDLDRYTILVPAYRESGVVEGLMRNLGQLDYPREKLEILLLLEADDVETLDAAKAAAPADIVRFITVPRGIPQTKPKACNVGLAFATGRYLVIYDAEDRPEPDQLKKAVAAFRHGGPKLAVVQAALNYFNADENGLTRLFTLEYSTWFDLMLPAMDRLDLVIPLGGTSNHFRTDVLRDIGGWDPFNVTEDADIGVRCAALGHEVAVVNSTTYEEANVAVGNWIRQRSRWIKGYLQTTLVHLRSPATLVRMTGVRGALSFGLLVGGTPLTFLAAPPLWGVTLLNAVAHPDWLSPALNPMAPLTTSILVVSFVLTSATGVLAAVRRRLWWLIPWAFLQPVYWLLHSVAAYKALWQLIRNPFYWEKTVHGLSRHAEPSLGAPEPSGTVTA
jgi:glycosyltransferase XagB